MIDKIKLHEDSINLLLNRCSDLLETFATVESKYFSQACQELLETDKNLKNLKYYLNKKKKKGILLIEGLPISDEIIGNSPKHWDANWSHQPYLKIEILQSIISSFFGTIFGWRTQENGRFLRHIVPIKEDKDKQLGGSSSKKLVWHTEEAFHLAKASTFTLACYRNHELASTNIVEADSLEIPKFIIEILYQKRFFFRADESHTAEQNHSKHWKMDKIRFGKYESQMDNPVSVFEEVDGQLRMTVDQAFMYTKPDDKEAISALDYLYKEMDRQKKSIILKQGDMLIIDNYKVAHGRSIYNPLYGERQRWMRRVNVHNNTALLSKYTTMENKYIIEY